MNRWQRWLCHPVEPIGRVLRTVVWFLVPTADAEFRLRHRHHWLPVWARRVLLACCRPRWSHYEAWLRSQSPTARPPRWWLRAMPRMRTGRTIQTPIGPYTPPSKPRNYRQPRMQRGAWCVGRPEGRDDPDESWAETPVWRRCAVVAVMAALLLGPLVPLIERGAHALAQPAVLMARAEPMDAPYGVGDIEVGTFNAAIGTGNQDVTIGSDLTAAASGTWAVMFWLTGSETTSGTWGPNFYVGTGFAANGGGSIATYATGSISVDGGGAGVCKRRIANASITASNSAGTAAQFEGSLTSFPTSTTMRINWAVVDSPHAYRIHYMIITGLTGAKVLNLSVTSGTGSKSYTGAGFQPELVLNTCTFANAALPVTGADLRLGFGCMNSAGEQWCHGIYGQDTANPSNTSRWQRTDSAVCFPDTTEAANWRASYTSMDADGFTLNWAAQAFGTSANALIVCCMKGIDSKIGSVAKSTGAAPVSQDLATGLTFAPKAAVVAIPGMSGGTGAPAAHAVWSIGATDASGGEATAGAQDADNAAPPEVNCVRYSDKGALYPNHNTATSNALGDVTLGGTTSVNWTTNNGDTPLVLFLLMAPKSGNTHQMINAS